MMKSETLIVGLGSSHGDDQFGWRVAEQLMPLRDDLNITVRLARSPVEILGWLDEAERLIVCDACQDLGEPGRVHCWRWPDDNLAELSFGGSHDLGLAAALDLAGRLGSLPADVSIWCAEGTGFGTNASMSPPVQAAVIELIERLVDPWMRNKT